MLSGPEATRDSVLGALPGHPVAHFACHGVSDLADPGASRLRLHDHATRPLTVAAISRLHLSGADLAYLSACSTTVTDLRFADEAVHITAAFQVDASRLRERRRALHHATRALRRRRPGQPTLRAAHIHVGT